MRSDFSLTNTRQKCTLNNSNSNKDILCVVFVLYVSLLRSMVSGLSI